MENLIWAGYRMKRRGRCVLAAWKDAGRFIRHSATLERKLGLNQLEALMVSQYHALEKGFSLPSTRETFGITHVHALLKWMQCYRERGFDMGRDGYQHAVSTLKAYYEHHKNHEDYLMDVGPELLSLFESANSENANPTLEKNRDEFPGEKEGEAYRHLVLGRCSVRMFTGEKVPDEKMLCALELSRHVPSSCNRQPWRVLRIRDPDRIEMLCKLQLGNRGFGHLAGEILIISADCSAFYGAHERNQPFVDGGMYSMALLMAIHSVGLGACALNWSAKPDADSKLREIFEIPDAEVVVMCIAVGVLPEKFRVARSEKKPLGDFLREDQK